MAEAFGKGHHLHLIDGSAFSMPDTSELQAAFGQPTGQKPGCGFPVAKILALFDKSIRVRDVELFVTASVGHRPSTSRNGGISSHSPFVNS